MTTHKILQYSFKIATLKPGENRPHSLGESKMRSHVFFIILTSLSKIFTRCHLKISHNKFSLKFCCAWHALQRSHTWKGPLSCSRGGYRLRREKCPDVRCGRTVKSMENDGRHLGMCCTEHHLHCKFSQRAHVTCLPDSLLTLSVKICVSVKNSCLLGRGPPDKCFPGHLLSLMLGVDV